MRISTRDCTRHIIFKLFAVVLVCLTITNGAAAYMSMDTFLEEEGEGLDVWAAGKSMIYGNSLSDESSIIIEKLPDVKKALFVWSGQTKRGAGDFIGIGIKPPSGEEQYLSADKFYTKESAGQVYCCISDITSIYEGGGRYKVTGLRSDAVSRGVYSVGGYAFIILFADREMNGNRKILVKSGILLLKPGEIHEIEVLGPDSGYLPEKVVVIGGHGHKGNASANLLNGISLSGGEDWDGSSGRFWDVDIFEVDSEENDIQQGLVLGFDSLLQWIYPAAVVFKLK